MYKLKSGHKVGRTPFFPNAGKLIKPWVKRYAILARLNATTTQLELYDKQPDEKDRRKAKAKSECKKF